MTKTLWTSEEAANYLGVEPSTLAAWRSDGVLNQPTYYKVGKLVKYVQSDLDKWLQSTVRCTGAEIKPEDGWLHVTNKLAQRIQQLDATLKAEMAARAELAARVESLELAAHRRHLFDPTELDYDVMHDTTHDREEEQDT